MAALSISATQPLLTRGAQPPLAGLTVSVLELLDRARRDCDHDAGAAKAALTKAASLLQSEAEANAHPMLASGGLAGWQVRRLREFIHASLGASISVEDLAREVNLSVSHFSRAFRQCFGMAPHAYLIRWRLEKACALLSDTDRPLADIAYATGFAAQAHLSKTFRRLLQTTPGAWRRRQIALARLASMPPERE